MLFLTLKVSRLFSVLFLVVAAGTLLQDSSCARILGIFPIACRSHQLMYQPIVMGLAKRGHNVTILSAFQNPYHGIVNYTELLLDETKIHSLLDTLRLDNLDELNPGWTSMVTWSKRQMDACHAVFSHPFVSRIIDAQEEPIDLLIVESYGNPCFNLLAEKLEVRVVTISPMYINSLTNIAIGNRDNPAYVPTMGCPLTSKMSFIQRLENLGHYFIGYYYHYAMLDEAKLGELAREYLRMDTLPQIDALGRRITLSFFYNHRTFISKPNPPDVIDVAGIHIPEAQPLPKDLQKVIDNAEHGVIFFSFGTIFTASSLPPAKIEIFRNVFSKIPQKILWRVDDPKLFKNFSDNVLISKWFPQRDILERRNVKAFISQCGHFSTIEAIHTATPVVGIPFFFDQWQDAAVLQEKGMAIILEFPSITPETLMDAIITIINDTEYAKNAQRMSITFKDRPMKPLDEALYWIEYVLRHNVTTDLRPVGADLPLYQFLMLDVIAFVCALALIIFYVFYTAMRKTFNILRKYFRPKVLTEEKIKKS